MHPPSIGEAQMDWIVEQFLETYRSFVKGELTREQALTLIIPVVFIGTFLARKTIWEFMKAQRRRIREYIQLQKAKEAIEAKQRRVAGIVNEIEKKLYSLQENRTSFSIKTREILRKIEDPSFTTETEDNKKIYLKKNIVSLDEYHEKSLTTIKEIENLLKDIAEIKRAEVLRRNSSLIASAALNKGRDRRASKNLTGRDQED